MSTAQEVREGVDGVRWDAGGREVGGGFSEGWVCTGRREAGPHGQQVSRAVLTEEENPGEEPICGKDPAFTSVTARGENQ